MPTVEASVCNGEPREIGEGGGVSCSTCGWWGIAWRQHEPQPDVAALERAVIEAASQFTAHQEECMRNPRSPSQHQLAPWRWALEKAVKALLDARGENPAPTKWMDPVTGEQFDSYDALIAAREKQ